MLRGVCGPDRRAGVLTFVFSGSIEGFVDCSIEIEIPHFFARIPLLIYDEDGYTRLHAALLSPTELIGDTILDSDGICEIGNRDHCDTGDGWVTWSLAWHGIYPRFEDEGISSKSHAELSIEGFRIEKGIMKRGAG